MKTQNRILRFFTLLLLSLALTACAAGDTQFTAESPAGFWYGMWHGMIAVISLIIHIFNDSVVVYEVQNTGGWYDFGFLMGVICIWGGGSHASGKSKGCKSRDPEWDEISEKVEAKVMRRMQEWAEDEDATVIDKDWEEIGGKVEAKLKRKIREWAESE